MLCADFEMTSGHVGNIFVMSSFGVYLGEKREKKKSQQHLSIIRVTKLFVGREKKIFAAVHSTLDIDGSEAKQAWKDKIMSLKHLPGFDVSR